MKCDPRWFIWSDGAIWGTGMSQDSLCVPPCTCKIIWNYKFCHLHVKMSFPSFQTCMTLTGFFKYWSQWGPVLFWNPLTFILDKAVYTFFKISDFVFHRRKTKWWKKVHFWVNNPLKCTHSQAIQDLDIFVSLWEHIWGNLALHHLLICREWVLSDW